MTILPATRCPYCHHDVVAGQDEQHGCEKCRAWHHQACWTEHGGCSACDFKAQVARPQQLVQAVRSLQDAFKEAANAIKTFPEYEEVYSIADNNCELPLYLVGGRAYRSLAMALYENDESEYGILGSDPFGSKNCDWDFLTPGFLGKGAYTPDKWCYKVYESYSSRMASPYSIQRNSSLVRWEKQELRRDQYLAVPGKRYDDDEVYCKIDLINLNRIVWENRKIKPPSWFQFWKKSPTKCTLDDYFASVPLDIQAVAFDPNKELFSGPGIKAVVDRKIRVNNHDSLVEAAKRENCAPVDFLRKKARSLPDFRWEYSHPKVNK